VKTRYVAPLALRQVPASPGNPFGGREAYSLSRVHRVGSEPVLLEDIYLEPEIFRGIDRFDLGVSSLSRIVADHYYMEPERVHQSFSVHTPKGAQPRALHVTSATPVLYVRRRLHFLVPRAPYTPPSSSAGRIASSSRRRSRTVSIRSRRRAA